jgi:hypothetical protein
MYLLSLLALAFLALLCCLALVAAKVFGAKNAEGRATAPGCLGGCAFALLLAVIGLAGLATLVAGVALATATPELGDAAHELRVGLREGVAELRQEFGRARRRAPRVAEFEFEPGARVETTERQPGPAAASWRARVVVSWSGHSEPKLELLEALARAGLEAPIDLALVFESDEADGQRSTATLSGGASHVDVDELRRRLEEALEQAGSELGLEFSVHDVRPEDLR